MNINAEYKSLSEIDELLKIEVVSVIGKQHSKDSHIANITSIDYHQKKYRIC